MSYKPSFRRPRAVNGDTPSANQNTANTNGMPTSAVNGNQTIYGVTLGASEEAIKRVMEPKPIAQQSDGWSTPQPVKVGLLSVLSVEADMIPEPARAWLTDIAYRMKCPLDYVTACFVVMVSSLIGTRLTIKPKFYDDWTIVPNLWGAMVGDPSTKKTPAANEVLKPLNRRVAEERAQYEAAIREYEYEVMEYEAQKKAFASQALSRAKGKTKDEDSTVARPDLPVKPIERRFMVNDGTIEKMGEILNENPAGILQYRDELTAHMASFDRPGHEQDRGFYLEGWNGNSSMVIDRIGRGTMPIKNVCISVFGSIQPSKLMPYLEAATGYENDGFIQRYQLAVYPNKANWEYTDETPDAHARNRAFTLIKSIIDADLSSISFIADEYNKFPYTRFSIKAQEVFKQWLIEWQTKVIPNETGLLLEHFAKYPSLMPSLALIFHVCNCADGLTSPDTHGKHLVSIEAAQMAVKWINYLQSHARRIYGMLDSLPVAAASELTNHLKARDLQDGFKVRDVERKNWTMLGSTTAAESAVSVLVSAGWLREVAADQKPVGRPESPGYQINPKIFIQNA